MKNKLNFHNIFKDKSKSENLWDLFVNGDVDAFKTIYNLYYQMLYNFGKRYLNDSEVEDAIHDTFLNILKYKNSTSEVKNVKAYLFMCLRNQIFKVKKAAKLEFELNYDTLEDDDDVNNEHEKELVFKKLKEIIKELSPREREIVYLKYFQNFSNIEISEMLDINYQTVRNILANAIKKLRVLGGDQLL